jgi:hypothetical protein
VRGWWEEVGGEDSCGSQRKSQMALCKAKCLFFVARNNGSANEVIEYTLCNNIAGFEKYQGNEKFEGLPRWGRRSGRGDLPPLTPEPSREAR